MAVTGNSNAEDSVVPCLYLRACANVIATDNYTIVRAVVTQQTPSPST